MYEKLFEYLHEHTGVERSTFDKFSSFFKVKKFSKNEQILSAGQVCSFNLFVNRGCIRFYSLNEDGKEHTRYFAFEGKFGTSLSSLISQEPSLEYIEALEDSEILWIDREDFYELVEKQPSMNFIYRNILEMAYTTSVKRIYDFQGEDALERLKWLMSYQPKILTRISNKVIASYLGITPYTLSRLKAQL